MMLLFGNSTDDEVDLADGSLAHLQRVQRASALLLSIKLKLMRIFLQLLHQLQTRQHVQSPRACSSVRNEVSPRFLKIRSETIYGSIGSVINCGVCFISAAKCVAFKRC